MAAAKPADATYPNIQLLDTRRLADPPPLFMRSKVFRVAEPAAGDETHPSFCRLLARSSRTQMCVDTTWKMLPVGPDHL